MADNQAKPSPPTPPRPLTRRQRAICLTYFAHGCRAHAAALALGITPARLRFVKSKPAARAYLDALEIQAADKLTTAHAARLLAPFLDR